MCEWREPEELATLLDLELRENGEQQHQLLQRVRDVAKYSVKTSKSTPGLALVQGLWVVCCWPH